MNFDESTNPQTDQVLTQMRQSQASAQLPPEVVAQGVNVQKSFAAPLMLIGLRSTGDRYDSAFLTNYAFINLNDPLTRVRGINLRAHAVRGDTSALDALRQSAQDLVMPGLLLGLENPSGR